jgi:nitroreductase
MVSKLIQKRYSPRSFSKDKIDKKILLNFFEAARLSPSSMNEQPWRFIISTSDDMANFDKMVSVLYESNKVSAVNAPFLILTLTKLRNNKNNKINMHAYFDA